MNRKNTWAAALGCLLLLSLSGIAAAIDDEEDSLVTRLAERVEELFGRVERLEGLWEGPGPAYLDSGNCVIAAVDPLQYKPVLQNESILKHMSQFDVIPQKYQLRSVQVDPESGELQALYGTYGAARAWVIERRPGCESQCSTDWRAAEG